MLYNETNQFGWNKIGVILLCLFVPEDLCFVESESIQKRSKEYGHKEVLKQESDGQDTCLKEK